MGCRGAKNKSVSGGMHRGGRWGVSDDAGRETYANLVLNLNSGHLDLQKKQSP